MSLITGRRSGSLRVKRAVCHHFGWARRCPSRHSISIIPHFHFQSLPSTLHLLSAKQMPPTNNMPVSSLLELSPEILCMIVSLLSRHDLAVCVRVNKSWYDAFMDSLWHTVELKEASRVVDRRVFDHVNSLYGPHLVKETVATKSPFLLNLHRIRILRVQYTSFLNLFCEQGASPLNTIPLEELSVDFDDNPKPPPPRPAGFGSGFGRAPTPDPPEPTDMEAVLQILRRSTRLLTFSFLAGALVRKQQLQNQARLLASLPASLEKLKMTSDSVYHGPDVITDQDQKTKALDLFLEMKKGTCFEKMTTLLMEGAVVDLALMVTLLEISPKLEELTVDGYQASWNDSSLAEVVSNVSSKGWKTLSFKSLHYKVGPLTVSAILKNSATLENLRLPECEAFDSKSIQKLLCSAPNLRRFDCIASYVNGELESLSLMASDIVDSAESWACLELETFKCYIGGVPRPDITSKDNGRPLTGVYNNGDRYSKLQSRTIQRQVLAQLGRLTKLREITLGKDVVNYESGNHQAHWNEEKMEGEYYSDMDYELGSQYQCLSMSLQDGLDELKGLRCLRRLTLEKMMLDMGEAEHTWMKENWPDYDQRYFLD